jgi:NAD(P)-dependent dehydrogenase (short-subunit alcohol dehydrogenase family)
MQVTIVTGAAGALGSAVVELLLERGHRVAAVDVPAAAPRLGTLEATSQGACLALPLDVTSPGAWTAALARLEADLGVPSGAVLTAGGWQGGHSFSDEPDDFVWRAMLEVNLETAQRSLRAILPVLLRKGSGSVVVVGSRAVERPWESEGAAAYAASKAALVTLMRTLADELLDRGVRVNAVLPSTLDTPANRRSMPDADPSRWVTPRSLAQVIAFLLSDDARDVSGAAIPVYGRA